MNLLVAGSTIAAFAGPVSQQRMQAVYEAVSTPHKFGLVMAPADNQHKMDCPTVFREGDSWYMTYLVYDGKGGKDGRGYETWLAKSDDLLHWTTLGRVLPFADKGWDPHQRGGYPALIDPTWGGGYGIKAYKNRYWMTYIGGDT
ncbi:MAG: beta-galactosidase, partial [Bacteroidales bacterium]|nr:beta-galactosidase [Bacteroidales bacterium]